MEQYAKKVKNTICFPPKTTTNPSINKWLYHTFKRLAFGERKLSKERKENCETFVKIQNSQTENQTFFLPFESKNLTFSLPLLLLTPEHLKAAVQVPSPRSRFKVSLSNFASFHSEHH